MSHAERATFLDLGFDRATRREAVERCVSWCQGPRVPHTVITANAAIMCMMRRDQELREACRAGDLTVADGMSVVWAARAVGQPVPERVAGVDLMKALLEEGGRRGLKVYFLGAREEVVADLASRAARENPGLVIAGHRNGYFSAGDHERIAEEIRALAPDMLFVGMPSPFKETWCQRYRDRLGVPVIMGVGGSFDVLSGHVRRAPRWMQESGLEWFWRLMMEPRKMWKRYLTTNGEFLWLTAREALPRRRGASGARLMRPPSDGAGAERRPAG